MINKNELRIGNLIIDPIMGSSYFKVTALGKTLCTYTHMQDFKTSYGKLLPIELTEWWLTKFGFTRKGAECNIPIPVGNGLDLSIEADGETCIVRGHFCNGVLTTDFDYAYVKNCKYVHELQNLFFALSGVELQLSST